MPLTTLSTTDQAAAPPHRACNAHVLRVAVDWRCADAEEFALRVPHLASVALPPPAPMRPCCASCLTLNVPVSALILHLRPVCFCAMQFFVYGPNQRLNAAARHDRDRRPGMLTHWFRVVAAMAAQDVHALALCPCRSFGY